MIEEKTNSKLDLMWIIPEIIGELFITGFIPIMMIHEISDVGVLSMEGMMRI